MVYYERQIIFPEPFRVPTYSISPFSTEKLRELNTIICSDEVPNQENLLNEKFGNHEFLMNAKEAIIKAISFYNLQKEDEVYIVTTTKNKYVSSCVTNQIEKYCKWSRTLSDNTKLIFVIHEFGVVLKNMEHLIDLNIPIIEDFAMSMFSEKEESFKYVSDFKIFSLPKFFPLQYGGVLTYNSDKFLDKIEIKKEVNFQTDLKKISHHFLLQRDDIIKKRKSNYTYYQKVLKDLDIKSRFNFSEKETPSVYMFSSDTIDLDGLKIFLQTNGIECSKFYGENSFFLPVHQNLEEFDIDYIANLIKYFVNENK